MKKTKSQARVASPKRAAEAIVRASRSSRPQRASAPAPRRSRSLSSMAAAGRFEIVRDSKPRKVKVRPEDVLDARHTGVAYSVGKANRYSTYFGGALATEDPVLRARRGAGLLSWNQGSASVPGGVPRAEDRARQQNEDHRSERPELDKIRDDHGSCAAMVEVDSVHIDDVQCMARRRRLYRIRRR